jgi:uncharacterized protein (TIGR03067 family)
MRLLLVLGLTFLPALYVAAVPVKPAKKKQDPAQEIKKLQGTWRIIFYETDGITYSADRLAGLGLLTFKGSNYSWTSDATPGKIVQIDPNTQPKTITYEFTAGSNKGKKELGIYELKGDTFKDCFAQPGEKRPTDFSAQRGSGHSLVIYERVK